MLASLALLAVISLNQTPEITYDFSKLDAKITALCKETKLPGAGLIVAKDGKVLFKKFYGSYGENTRVRIASSTKWITAATLMTLVDQKLIQLDEPVSRVLPKFKGDHGAITLRHLLSHTSGLPPYDFGVQDLQSTLEKGCDAAADLPMLAKPGTVFNYGSVSFQVAGRIAEVLTGKPYAKVFSENLLKPLGMTMTGFDANDLSKNPGLAGNLRMNLDDYSRFLEMILNKGQFRGKTVLSPEAIQEMESNATAGVGQDRPDQARIETNMSYGLGLWREMPDGNQAAFQVSCPGAYGFHPWINRRSNVYGIWMIEDTDGRSRKGKLNVPGEVMQIIRGKETIG